MSRTYAEICASINFPLENYIHLLPVQKKLLFGYHEGKAIEYKTLAEAKKHKLYETIYDPVSQKEIQEFWADRTKKENLAADIFKTELRSDFVTVSDALYDMCYEAAKTKSRKSSDYEEIPGKLKFFVDFAVKAVAIEKEQPTKTEETDQTTTNEVSEPTEQVAELEAIPELTQGIA